MDSGRGVEDIVSELLFAARSVMVVVRLVAPAARVCGPSLITTLVGDAEVFANVRTKI
jgi:hypothetical protein